ncbi:sugar ABC transporter permease [Aeromicrobium sp. Root236]|uniref:ABC transporter permease n=1 Tax=Aeromicrobium sp. Root236 TaxID=1736498 RepID=UPI000700CD6C|nr:ABC transporter permease [Aeromicrobium sp. Root236]KRC65801.1 sugar ABC transporter permease [Aeromicrobium sp. Root236]
MLDSMKLRLHDPDVHGSRSVRAKNIIGDYGIVIVLIAVMAYFSVATSTFLSADNLINVIRQSSIVGFVALGMTFVMITAGIDLSVGSVVGLASITAASLADGGSTAFILPIVIGLAAGALVGLVNANLIIRAGILPFLATLATMAVVRSACLIYTNGQPLFDLNTTFAWLGTGMLGPIPVPVALFGLAALLMEVVLSKTQFGKHVYAVGGDVESAQMVGIRVKRVVIVVYLIAGVMAAIGGVVLAARVNGADPLVGTGYELQAIAAVVIGGTSLFGGKGSIRGTVLGVLLLGIMLNGLNLLNVSGYYQQGVQGLILIFAVILNGWRSD